MKVTTARKRSRNVERKEERKAKPLVLEGDERIERLGRSGGDSHSLSGRRDLRLVRKVETWRRRRRGRRSRLVDHLHLRKWSCLKKKEVAVEREGEEEREKWRNHMERARLSTKVYYMWILTASMIPWHRVQKVSFFLSLEKKKTLYLFIFTFFNYYLLILDVKMCEFTVGFHYLLIISLSQYT